MTSVNQQSALQSPWIAFLVAQLIVVPAVIAVPLLRSWSVAAGLVMPRLQDKPLAIAPLYNDPQVITDEQLRMVLTRLRPRLNHPQPKVNFVDHALRFWGVESRFRDPDCLDGESMRAVLLNHTEFAQAWGESTAPLLEPIDSGLAVRTQAGLATASHVDHTLATLAETGTPLSYPVQSVTGRATVNDIMRAALARFSLNQQEYEWTTLALALYSPTADSWQSMEGEQINFDRLADRIMRQRMVQGVCFGNHRLFTLVVLLRVDDQHQILTAAARERVLSHLANATHRLVTTQSPDGWWDINWSGPHTPYDDASKLSKATGRLLATGHALEWWAISPPELHPPRDVLVRAGQWLAAELAAMDEQQVEDNYTVLTHVGRALALWRGAMPAPLLDQLTAGTSETRTTP